MKRLKILIVDDEPITRLDLKEMLEENGYEVVGEGKNGNEAIEKARTLQPDLIIMDVKMPEMNGVKAASVIRGFSDCAVLLLTAYSYRELIEDAKKASINAYLVKPVKERELLPAIEIAFSQREQLQTLNEKVKKMEQKMEDRKKLKRQKAFS
ncbi:ANTAR domain-containing response regulator [Halalkalibacter alkalisediminis]|uniref:ANTAR domain-containing response regulator n=1 Tax=Halalkalibacter alkalisediminis TaxID=935616 RepID=UPI00364112FB